MFLGTLTAQMVVDSWHDRQEKKIKEASEKPREWQNKVLLEQIGRIRLVAVFSHDAD
jgi:hypothetical protein